MAAVVNVIQPFIADDGAWRMAGQCELTTEEATRRQDDGYLEILSVDGGPYTRGACCADH